MLLLDLVLDRQPVAVPARHVGRVEARHRLRLDHHVLQDLVDRVAHVDVAVGVGRAVVQDELRPAPAAPRGCARRACVSCQCPDPAGLALGEVAAHGERRLGQVERALVVGLRSFGISGSHRVPVARKYARAASQSRPIWADELVERGEVGLVAQLLQELDREAAAVEVAGEIEEECFERRRAAFAHGRVDSEARHSLESASCCTVAFYRKDPRAAPGAARPRRMLAVGNPSVAAALRAVHDAPADRVGTPEQARRGVELARARALRAPRVLEMRSPSTDDRRAALRLRSRARARPAARLADVARRAPRRSGSPLPPSPSARRWRPRRRAAKASGVEAREARDRSAARRRGRCRSAPMAASFSGRRGEARGRLRRREELARQRLEGEHRAARGRAARAIARHALEDGLVAEVHAVEAADGDGRVRARGGVRGAGCASAQLVAREVAQAQAHRRRATRSTPTAPAAMTSASLHRARRGRDLEPRRLAAHRVPERAAHHVQRHGELAAGRRPSPARAGRRPSGA